MRSFGGSAHAEDGRARAGGRGLLGRVLGGLALGVLGLFTAPACTDSSGMLVIVHAQVPLVEEGACKIPVDRQMDARRFGTLDVGLDKDYPYFVYPLVANNLPPLHTEGPEANRIGITGARVRLEPPPGVTVEWRGDCPREFDHPTQATIEPGDEAGVVVEAIRSCHSNLFRELFKSGRLSTDTAENIYFRAIIRPKGRHGGGQVLGDPFEFPIRVCHGCLQTGFEGTFAMFDYPVVPACEKLATNPFMGNKCNLGQDQQVLCCMRDTKGEKLECPANPTPVTGSGGTTTPTTTERE